MNALTTPMPSPLPRRGLQGFLGAILAGIAAGGFAWVALVFGGQNILFQGLILLVPVPLFMAGLGIGRSDAIVAMLLSAAIITVSVSTQTMLALLIIYLSPVLFLSLLATRYRYDEQGNLFWYPTGRLLTLLTLYPVCVFGLASFLAGTGGMEAVVRNASVDLFGMLFKNEPAVLNSPEMKALAVDRLTNNLPVGILLAWISSLAVTGIWSQVALTGNKMALRPMPRITDLDLPMSLLVLFAIMVLLASFFDGQVAFFARCVLIPLALPYFLVGVGLVHLWAQNRKYKAMWLTGFYFSLFFGWPIILSAIGGVLEPWLHLRKKITGWTAARNKKS